MRYQHNGQLWVKTTHWGWTFQYINLGSVFIRNDTFDILDFLEANMLYSQIGD